MVNDLSTLTITFPSFNGPISFHYPLIQSLNYFFHKSPRSCNHHYSNYNNCPKK